MTTVYSLLSQKKLHGTKVLKNKISSSEINHYEVLLLVNYVIVVSEIINQ